MPLLSFPRFAGIALVTCLVTCPAAFGQYGGVTSRGLDASGTADVDVEPDRMKLVMWIKAEELDAQTAAQVLLQHRERVREELKKMMAIEESIQFSAPTVEKSSNDEEQREMLGRMRMMQQGAPDMDASEIPKTYTAFCAVKAEWRIPQGNELQLAILPATLRERIEKADLAGNKNQPQLDGDIAQRLKKIKEVVEEQMGPFYSDGSEADVPQIYFVGRYTDAQVEAASKVAFNEAKKNAAMLARATGAELGGILSIASSIDDSEYYDNFHYGYDYEARELPTQFVSPGKNETQSSSVDSLGHEVSVFIKFDIRFAGK